MKKLTPRASQTAVVLVALATLVAGCGSSSSTSSSTSTSASAASGTRAKLVACLKQHGITLPAGRRPGAGAPPGGAPGAGSGTPPAGAPGSGTGTTPSGQPPAGGGFFGGGGANASKFRAAFKACGANFPAGGRAGFRGGFNRQNIQKYVTCVRQHGYNLPNPNFSGNGPVFPANIRTNKKFQSASKACQSLLAPPQGAGSAGGSGGGSST